MGDLQSSPGSEHYRKIKPEPIEVTESWNLGFHLGNAMKYLSRHTFKGKPVDDLLKAIWYIKRHLLVNYGVDADKPRKGGKPRIYLSGPITGMPNHNIEAFQLEQDYYESQGYEVINPLKNFGGNLSLTRAEYMRQDIEHLLNCECVAMLPGWEESPGARLEYCIAKEINLTVFTGRAGAKMND